jgi:hypothetical protein
LPYCRKCGAKLEEDAKFCYNCGTPVLTYNYASSHPQPQRPIRRDPILVAGIIIVVILISAVVVTALFFASVQSYSFGQTNEVVTQSNVTVLNLNFRADNAKINIIPQNYTNDAVAIYTSGSGSKGIGTKNPVQIIFTNQTVRNTLTVNSQVTTSGFFAGTPKVTCNIYLNPSMSLNLNVTTDNGQVILTSNESATFQTLNLKSTTGEVKAILQNDTVIAGDISLKTTTGEVIFTMNQANVEGNRTFNLQTTTGTVNTQIDENQSFGGNVQVNASAVTGNVDLSMNIDNAVGARIESRTDIGSINANVNNFSGNKSPLQSNNYPSKSNFVVNLKTNIGTINIDATYQSASSPSLRN